MDRTEPFYIEVITGSYIRLTDASFTMDLLEYSYDKVNWYSFDIYDYGGYIVNVNPGDKVYMRAKPSVGTYYVSDNNRRYFTNNNPASVFNVGGNIMSLLYGDQFTGSEVDFPSGTWGNFYGLFQWFQVADASQLLLPATTLTFHCYSSMFESGWTSNRNTLVKAPTITQATLPPNKWPYDYMFRNCNSLESITIENTNIRNADYILYGVAPKTIVYKKEGVTTPSNPNHLTVVTLKNTPFNVADAKQWSINGKNVKRVIDSQGRIIWGKPIDYTEPFYFHNRSIYQTNIFLYSGEGSPSFTIEGSNDRMNWRTMTFPYYMGVGEKLYIRAKTDTWCNVVNGYEKFKGFYPGGDNVYVGGNIMSLIYGEDFTGNERSFPVGSNRNFYYFLAGNLSSVSSSGGFRDCSSLILPATTLTERCYCGMFYHNVRITSTPALPSTILAPGCYYFMFAGCSSLIETPVLMATTKASNCYDNMFESCLGIQRITCNLEGNQISNQFWVGNITGSGVFYKNANATWVTGDNGIPSGWTVVDL